MLGWVHLSGGPRCPGESCAREWGPDNPGTLGLGEGAESRGRGPKGTF